MVYGATMQTRLMGIFSIFLLCLINFGQLSYAQEVLPQTISKDDSALNSMDFCDAIKYSLINNNNIRAMRKHLSATERDIGIARSTMLPHLKFGEIFAATNNPTDTLSYRLNQARATANDLTLGVLNNPDSVTNFLTQGILEQRILDRKAVIEIKMAKKEYSANGYVFLRKQEELVNTVAQAYLKVCTNQEYVEVAELAINDTKAHLAYIESKKNGNSSYDSDAKRAKSALAAREQNLVTAQMNLNIAKRNLGLQLGLEIPIEVSNTIPELQLEDMDFYKNVSVLRNDIKASEIRVENAKNNIQAAQSEWFPTLSALGSYNFYNATYPFGGTGSNYIVGAFFRWEALDGNKRKYEILKAKDMAEEAREYLDWLKKTVSFRVYEVYSNVEEHQKNMKLSIESLKQAQEDIKLVEKEWKSSKLAYVALIDAQVNLDRARENLVKNRFELREDLITLNYESGIICQVLGLN